MALSPMIDAAKQHLRDIDAYLMDTEQWVLEHKWPAEQTGIFYWSKPHPTGTQRHEDQEWARLIQESLDSCNSPTVPFEAYCAWVVAGCGEEWFQ